MFQNPSNGGVVMRDWHPSGFVHLRQALHRDMLPLTTEIDVLSIATDRPLAWTRALYKGLSILVLASGCAKTDSDGSPSDTARGSSGGSIGGSTAEIATFEEALTEVLVPSCGFDSCHGSGAGRLRINDRQTEEEWLEMESIVLAGRKFIEPGNAAGSYLIHKMEGTSTIAGAIMPPSGMLSEDRLQIVRSWIDNIE